MTPEPLSTYVRRTRGDCEGCGPDWLADEIAELEAKYEALRHAAQEAVDARRWALLYDHGEPDRPIMTMARLSGVLKRQAPDNAVICSLIPSTCSVESCK